MEIAISATHFLKTISTFIGFMHFYTNSSMKSSDRFSSKDLPVALEERTIDKRNFLMPNEDCRGRIR